MIEGRIDAFSFPEMYGDVGVGRDVVSGKHPPPPAVDFDDLRYPANQRQAQRSGCVRVDVVMRACARALVPDPELDLCLAGETIATHRLRRWPAKNILEER